MNECLDGRLVEVTKVACCLAWLLPQHHGLGADQAESINDHLRLTKANTPAGYETSNTAHPKHSPDFPCWKAAASVATQTTGIMPCACGACRSADVTSLEAATHKD